VPEHRPSEVTDLGHGVHALSTMVDLRQPVSWVPPDVEGFDPSNCYLVVEGDEAHLVDTGLRAHGEALIAQLSSLIGGDVKLHVTATRVEPDCLGSLDMVADRFRVVRVSSQSNVIPFNYLGPLADRYPGVVINNGIHPGDVIVVEGRRFEAVEPAVRTLPTLWYFDHDSGVLFTSDFFGHRHVKQGSNMDAPVNEEPDESAVRAHVLAKFDWLKQADTSSLVTRLDSIFKRLAVTAIAPGHGCVISGDAEVQEAYELTRAALVGLGRSVAAA
jgi:flavorubredoxin